MTPEHERDEIDRVGLCAVCAHGRSVKTTRNAVFYRCERSATDAAFAKYPRLPVRLCAGYERKILNPD